ncbi:MAG TPA: hemolysin family protein [Gemmatimonadota bacterium]|nr:hemolysin family protein [Gemmatimonadota bacterium]
MDALVPIVIIAALILLNGLFVAAEFAIIGVPRGAVEHRAASGDSNARQLREILRDPRRQDRYIATAQLGITLASLGLGMYGEHVLAGWFAGYLESLGAARWVAAHGLASLLAVVVLTYFHIVVGEMVPKSLALTYAERTALRIMPLMLLVKRLFYPLVIVLNGMGNGLLALMGIRRERNVGHLYTPEELELVIRESEKGGLLHAESGRVLRELFDFGALTAEQAAIPRIRIVAVPLGADPETIAGTLRRSPHTRYPVYERDLDHIVGFVHARDLLRRLQDGGVLDAASVHPAVFVPETMSLELVLRVMHEAGSQLAVVMDEHGGTTGILTIEDLSAEIVGETELAPGRTREVYRDADGRLRVAGTVRLEELGERLGRELAHDEVETVSGLVLHLLGRPPRVGDGVEWQGVRFEVVTVAGRGVVECVVT